MTENVITPGESTREGGTAITPQIGAGWGMGGEQEAAAIAEIQAAYMVAQARPRDMNTVREKVLAECRRPAFAACARYSKPVGGRNTIQGFSIRFAEAVMRAMGNIRTVAKLVREDAKEVIYRIETTDLESNFPISQDVRISKVVERRSLREGQRALYTRQNSNGQCIYGVAASEDDMRNKVGSAHSRIMRNQGLRLLPGDIKDEADALIRETIANRDAKDPAAAKKRVLDGFFGIGVPATELVEYLGHSIDSISPAELAGLRDLFRGISDNETTWHEVLGMKRESATAQSAEQGDPVKTPEPVQAAPKSLDELAGNGTDANGSSAPVDFTKRPPPGATEKNALLEKLKPIYTAAHPDSNEMALFNMYTRAANVESISQMPLKATMNEDGFEPSLNGLWNEMKTLLEVPS